MDSGTAEQQPADSVDDMTPAQMQSVLRSTMRRASPDTLRYLLKTGLALVADEFRSSQGALAA